MGALEAYAQCGVRQIRVSSQCVGVRMQRICRTPRYSPAFLPAMSGAVGSMLAPTGRVPLGRMGISS